MLSREILIVKINTHSQTNFKNIFFFTKMLCTTDWLEVGYCCAWKKFEFSILVSRGINCACKNDKKISPVRLSSENVGPINRFSRLPVQILFFLIPEYVTVASSENLLETSIYNTIYMSMKRKGGFLRKQYIGKQ